MSTAVSPTETQPAPPLAAAGRAAPAEGLASLFLISGFAALIYQNVWQRVLFTTFGVNIESVTVIVSVFMLGLGIGSLAGGVLSRCWPHALPELFLISEVAIGAFGLVSLPLIRATAGLTLHSSLWTLSLTTFALLVVPTTLMGATLPVLVSHLHQQWHNVGQAVARLYFLNTLGWPSLASSPPICSSSLPGSRRR